MTLTPRKVAGYRCLLCENVILSPEVDAIWDHFSAAHRDELIGEWTTWVLA